MKGRNKRDNKTKYLLILLLLIAVGYAAIATTLKINGTSTIKSAKWDVYWENPQVLIGSVTQTAPTLSESDTKATFNVTLNEPGDYYEFTIDAVNNGSLDAKIDTNGIVKQVKNSSGQVVNPTILKYEVTNNDQEHTAIQEGHILAKKSGNTPTKETYRVRVEYRNDEGINPEDLDDTNDLVFTIEFSVKYVQGPKAVDPYSMASMCPGCVYMDGVEGGSYGIGGEQPSSDILTDDYTTLGRTFYGMVIENNQITRGFVCGYNDNNQVLCFEGYDTSKYENNVDIFNHFYPECDVDPDSSNIYCEDSYDPYIQDDGDVGIKGSAELNICITDTGYLYTGSGC